MCSWDSNQVRTLFISKLSSRLHSFSIIRASKPTTHHWKFWLYMVCMIVPYGSIIIYVKSELGTTSDLHPAWIPRTYLLNNYFCRLKHMLKRRKESDTYLATFRRHHRSVQMMMKRDNLLELSACTVAFISWWKPQCWLKAPISYLLSFSSVHSSIVHGK